MLYQKVQLDLTAVSEVQGENQRRHSFPKCFHRSDNGYRKYINTLNNYLKSNAEMTGVLNIISLLKVYPTMARCCSWARNQSSFNYYCFHLLTCYVTPTPQRLAKWGVDEGSTFDLWVEQTFQVLNWHMTQWKLLLRLISFVCMFKLK